jgi:hypothetical protein
MACTALSAVTKGCSNNQGGIFSLWINDTDNVSNKTVDLASHTITGLTASPKFTQFEFNRNVGSVVTEPKIDLVAGSTYYESKITLVFNRREGSKSRALNILAEGQRFLDIIYKDANDLYWYIDHAQLDGGAEETGTARADGSKYNVTFTAQMAQREYGVTASLITSLT